MLIGHFGAPFCPIVTLFGPFVDHLIMALYRTLQAGLVLAGHREQGEWSRA